MVGIHLADKCLSEDKAWISRTCDAVKCDLENAYIGNAI
jgi:hypothetical protein